MKLLRVGVLALGALVAVSGTVSAQDEGEKDESKLSTSRKSELDRMKSRLELSDAQYDKVVKIFEKADAELKDLLTANQKETYNERYNRASRGGFGGGGMGGMMGGMAQRMVDGMTEQLDLNEEQKAQVKKIMDANMEKVQKVMAEARETGDWSKMREVGTTMRDEGMKQIKEILNDDQKKKFDEMAQNMGGMMGGRGGFGRRGGDRGGESRRSRGSSAEWRLRAILRDLNLSEDEKLILEPTIKAVLEAQDAARKAIDEARKALRESSTNTTDEAALKAAIGKVRDAEKGAEKDVDAKRAELRELVTFAQEAVLVGHGVLK
ncbi:MAG: hypothetical protein ACYTGX_16855 [Planctomycetota bacterium]|jgi:Spy/CpxP family protein refolding chaperone